MIKIEEGKSYRDRSGTIWRNARKNENAVNYPWKLTSDYGRTDTFTDTGKWSRVSRDLSFDLVAELTDGPEPTSEIEVYAMALARIVELTAENNRLRKALTTLIYALPEDQEWGHFRDIKESARAALKWDDL